MLNIACFILQGEYNGEQECMQNSRQRSNSWIVCRRRWPRILTHCIIYVCVSFRAWVKIYSIQGKATVASSHQPNIPNCLSVAGHLSHNMFQCILSTCSKIDSLCIHIRVHNSSEYTNRTLFLNLYHEDLFDEHISDLYDHSWIVYSL